MKILVTGSKGFIGKHLILALSKNHAVLSFDLKDDHDIRNKKQVDRVIEGVDVVYHLAALTDVQQSFLKPNDYWQTNGSGTFNIALACQKYKKKLIYTSTVAAYDPYSSPYAYSKNIAEQLVSYLATPLVILRLFNVYGEGMNKTTMISRFQKENPITIYGDGTQTRDFIHIDDVLQIMVDCLKPKWDGFCGDVGTGESRSVLSIAKRYGKPIIHEKLRQEVRHSQANIRLLRKFYKKPFKRLSSYIDKYNKV